MKSKIDRIDTKLVKIICWIISVSVIACFIFLITKYRFPIGDDCENKIITQEAGNYENGTIIETWSQAIEGTIYNYCAFGGRITPSIMCDFFALSSQQTTAIACTVIYLVFISIIILNVIDEVSDILDYSVFCAILFWILVYKNPYVGWLLMWTMISHYVVPTSLFLIYFFIAKKVFFIEKKEKKVKILEIFAINILGLVTGCSNEAVVATFLVMFGMFFLQHIGNLRYSIVKTIICNIGLFLGGIISIFSPGNRVRMTGAHDVGINRPYIDRLHDSFLAHMEALSLASKKTSFIIALLIVITIVYLVRYKEERFLVWKMLPFMVGTVASIFIWGAASYTPRYGMISPMVLFYIALFIPVERMYSRIKNDKKLVSCICSLMATLVICYVIIMKQMPWIIDLKETRIEWDKRIEETQPGEEVIVPKFPESCYNRYTMYNYINDIELIHESEYRKYYGVKITPQ